MIERNFKHLLSRIEKCRIIPMKRAVYDKVLRDPLYDGNVQTRLRLAITWTYSSNRLWWKPKIMCDNIRSVDLVLDPEHYSNVCSETSEVREMLRVSDDECNIVLPMTYVVRARGVRAPRVGLWRSLEKVRSSILRISIEHTNRTISLFLGYGIDRHVQSHHSLQHTLRCTH